MYYKQAIQANGIVLEAGRGNKWEYKIVGIVKVISITPEGSRTEPVFFNGGGFDVLFIMHIFCVTSLYLYSFLFPCSLKIYSLSNCPP